MKDSPLKIRGGRGVMKGEKPYFKRGDTERQTTNFDLKKCQALKGKF